MARTILTARRLTRRRMAIALHAWIESTSTGVEVRELSAWGLAYEAEQPVPVGSRVCLRARIPNVRGEPQDVWLDVDVRTVRPYSRSRDGHPPRYRVGGSLDRIDDSTRARLSEFCRLVASSSLPGASLLAGSRVGTLATAPSR
jgi:hypothetical protein